MPDDVREWVRRSLAGDQSAMAALVDQFRDQVFGLCFRMLGHRHDAEDVAQESFVRALRSLATFDQARDFKTWLLAIAGNRCRTHLSLRKRRPQPSELVDQIPDNQPDDRAARQLTEEVRRGLERLRDDYRQAFLLYHNQHLSYAEIGAALECPVGTVKTWIHRARQELADYLRTRGIVEDERHVAPRV